MASMPFQPTRHHIFNRAQKIRTIQVTGVSMYPLIKHAATISFVPYAAAQPVRVGDIVLFFWHKQLIAHRIIRVRQAANELVMVLEKGDNAPRYHWISSRPILGRVVRINNPTEGVDLVTWRWQLLSALIGYYWQGCWPIFRLMRYLARALPDIHYWPGRRGEAPWLFERLFHRLSRLLPRFLVRLMIMIDCWLLWCYKVGSN
jgi:signal peptidase I